MRIAVISDIHDHLFKLDQALTAIRRAGDVGTMLCCGDLCSPFVIPRLAQGFGGRIHIVFGNNDGDRYRITEQARSQRRVVLHGESAELRLGGRTFCINHFDHIGRSLAHGNTFDVVCFGHNHRLEVMRLERTLLINPGAIMGEVPRPRTATFVLYSPRDERVGTYASGLSDRTFRRVRLERP